MEAMPAAERDRWRTSLTQASAALPGVLAELVPGLTASLGTAAPVPDVDAADARHRLHRAAIQLVSVTSRYRTVVLAVDDLQWADRDSLLLLVELLAVAPRNVLVVGTHRTGEFDAEADFASATIVDLSLMSVTETEEMLAAAAGDGAELADVAAEFHHRTGATRCRFASSCTARNTTGP